MKQRWKNIKNKLRYMWIDKNETKNRMKKKNTKLQSTNNDSRFFFKLKNTKRTLSQKYKSHNVRWVFPEGGLIYIRHMLSFTCIKSICFKKGFIIPRNDDNASCIRPERVTNEDSRRVRKKNDSAIGMWYILTNQRLSGENALFSR